MTDERYDAFISYNHAADDRLAPAIERGLQRLAKPWYRLRAISVYRDTSDTGLTPSLWGTVQRRLDDSGWLILLACPESAASRWVEQEVTHWCDTKGSDGVLLVLTGGDLFWDRAADGFSPATTALSPGVARRFASEPLHLDLRWAKTGVEPSLSDARFRADMARLASPIRGLPPDELEGEDIRLHRTARRLARAAVATVVALAVAASVAAAIAVANAHRAEKRAREATARQLGLLALDLPASRLDEALLLSVVAAELDSEAGVERYRSSRTLLGRYSRLVALLPVGDDASDVSVRNVAVSADGATVAATVQSEAGGTRLVQWDRSQGGEPVPTVLPAGELSADRDTIIAIDATSSRALVVRADQLQLVDPADGAVVTSWPHDPGATVAAITGDRAVIGTGSALLLVDAGSGTVIADGTVTEPPAAIGVLGELVVAASDTGEVTLWRARGERLQPAPTAGSVGEAVGLVGEAVGHPQQLAVAAGGSRIVVVGDGGTAIIDPATATVVASGTGTGPLSLDPSAEYAAVGGTSLTVWDVGTGQRAVAVPDKASAMAWSGCAADAPCRLVTAGETIDVWEPATGQRTRLADQTNAQSVAITSDGATVVSGGWGPTVAVWTLDVLIDDSGRSQLTPPGAPAATDPTGAIARRVGSDSVEVTSADRTVTIATGTVERMRLVTATQRLLTIDGPEIRLFDTATGGELPLDERCSGDLVAVSPGGGRLVAHRASDGRTVVCDTVTGTLVAGGTFRRVAIPAEVIAVGDDGAVALGGAGFIAYHELLGSRFADGVAVDARFGREPVTIRALAVHSGRVAAGVRPATGRATPARVLLWDAGSGGDAVQFDTDHMDVPAIALVGGDAEIVVAAGRDRESDDVIVQAWEAATRRRLGRGLGGLTGEVVALGGDDRSIVGTDAEGRTLRWSLDRDTRREVCAIVGRPLRADEWATAAGGVLRRYDATGVCD